MTKKFPLKIFEEKFFHRYYNIICSGDGNCAEHYNSGWWFDSCFAANLNGKYYDGNYCTVKPNKPDPNSKCSTMRDGIYWGRWPRLSGLSNQNRIYRIFFGEADNWNF